MVFSIVINDIRPNYMLLLTKYNFLGMLISNFD